MSSLERAEEIRRELLALYQKKEQYLAAVHLIQKNVNALHQRVTVLAEEMKQLGAEGRDDLEIIWCQ
jgi:iron uptake system EfeUOB component EfeO/EfeM